MGDQVKNLRFLAIQVDGRRGETVGNEGEERRCVALRSFYGGKCRSSEEEEEIAEKESQTGVRSLIWKGREKDSQSTLTWKKAIGGKDRSKFHLILVNQNEGQVRGEKKNSRVFTQVRSHQRKRQTKNRKGRKSEERRFLKVLRKEGMKTIKSDQKSEGEEDREKKSISSGADNRGKYVIAQMTKWARRVSGGRRKGASNGKVNWKL